MQHNPAIQPSSVSSALNSAAGLPPGLGKEEAAALLAAGKGNLPLKRNTRSVGRILLDNSLTLFNLINGILAIVVLIVCLFEPKYFRNLLFMGVVVANTAIISFQEIRAKMMIDRLEILTEPRVDVRRSGEEFSIPVAEIVPGDVLRIKAGQQISIDGSVLFSDSFEVDESLLTGESNGVRKAAGDPVLSGSVALAGSAYIEVEKVSAETFAARIADEAKTEKRTLSPLMQNLNRILKVISIIMFPLGSILLFKVFINDSSAEMLRGIVATSGLLVSMLPEGLILLTSIAMAVSVVRMGQRKALVQKIPSIEMLARVDVLCLDKTGTITSGKMNLLGVVDLTQDRALVLYGQTQSDQNLLSDLPELQQAPALAEELQQAMASFCHAFPEGNATQEALCAAFQNNRDPWRTISKQAFSSRRKWSAASFDENGSWYVGAAEMLLDQTTLQSMETLMTQITLSGYRLLVLAHSPHILTEQVLAKGEPLPDLSVKGLLIIADEIRSDVTETFDYFKAQGVEIKVISGDHPYTLEAIAKRAGLDDYANVVDLSRYPEDADFSEVVQQYRLFGRVSPFQKRALLKALQQQGHTVAMTGDGVNDVLALKDSDCGVAMASGSEAARAVADIVLLDNRMSLMVDAVYEGRRVINNIQKVSSLFLIKTTYACVFALSMLTLPIIFPILPIQGTLINSVTVGIPSFFLALKANKRRVQGEFMANVMPLAWPAGLVAAILLVSLQIARGSLQLSLPVTSTYAMFALITVGLRALYAVSKPFDLLKTILFSLCVLLSLGTIILFPSLLQLALPSKALWWHLILVILLALGATELFYRLSRTKVMRKLSRRLLGLSAEDIQEMRT